MQKTLTELEKAFIKEYTSGEFAGNGSKSVLKAGYQVKPENARQMAYDLKNRLKNQIEEETKKELQSQVPMAISVLKELLSSTKTPPSTKLMAVNSLLDRSGFSVPTQIEDITHKKDSLTLKKELDGDVVNIIDNLNSLSNSSPELKEVITNLNSITSGIGS